MVLLQQEKIMKIDHYKRIKQLLEELAEKYLDDRETLQKLTEIAAWIDITMIEGGSHE